MKSLAELGVVIPLGILFLLVIFGTLNIGITEDKSFVDSISFDELTDCEGSTTGYDNEIILQRIVIKNSFILSKLKEMPQYTACYSDLSSPRASINYYVDGESDFTDSNSFIAQRYRAFEVPAGSTKTVEIKLRKQCYSMSETDYLYLFEYDSTKRNYISSGSISDEDLDDAIKIRIDSD